MGTRSVIARENADGTVDAIYCHSDGYLSWNGRILAKHYADPAVVDELIALGGLSSLGEKIGQKVDFGDPAALRGDQCRAYHRDRGEELQVDKYKNVTKLLCKETLDDFWAEHVYIFRKGGWHHASSAGHWKDLAPLIPKLVTNEIAVT
jgi:hypothetical protein